MSNNTEFSRQLKDGKRQLLKDMQTNEKEKIHDKFLKKSRTSKSVSPTNIFGSFFS